MRKPPAECRRLMRLVWGSLTLSELGVAIGHDHAISGLSVDTPAYGLDLTLPMNIENNRDTPDTPDTLFIRITLKRPLSHGLNRVILCIDNAAEENAPCQENF